jgi:hypothetical protein
MIIKGIIDEDFVNYKVPSMTIMFPKCDFKCDKECGQNVCQNSKLVNAPDIEVSYDELIKRYLLNPITGAIVFQGLEPMDSFSDVMNLIMWLRLKYKCNDDIVIYTGYKKEEISWFINSLIYEGKNIIIKYGRYIPNQKPHYDEVLGVMLASDNQYAERIS